LIARERENMQKEEIINKINTILINDFEINEELIKPEADLVQQLEIDSLDFIDFVVAIERNFGIKVKSEDLRTIRTVNDLYNFIISRKAG
jgi:acyl carrier protein